MTTRRRFLQAGAAAGALGLQRALAADGSQRVALVIGNEAYKQSALANPVNDARAVADLFGRAGVSTVLQSNAVKAQMAEAIGTLANLARKDTVREVFFYYAGHGVQLEWRNYLLPVDADVATRDDIREKCIDLGLLLGQLERTRGKTVIVILDACRNDPFGGAFRPEQRGLSQFDAPPGSLLAYATSPGNVAADGTGAHGLYTENLVRELSVRGARIEDAFKRVRLNVRLASRGMQVPWETTSLESDVYLFESDRRKLSESELEKQLEEDIAAWGAIKASTNADDWAGYLRKFPNGRFAEIAQMRLARLLTGAVAARPETVPVVKNEQDYNALPIGALYVDPQGVQRRKSQ